MTDEKYKIINNFKFAANSLFNAWLKISTLFESLQWRLSWFIAYMQCDVVNILILKLIEEKRRTMLRLDIFYLTSME